MTKKYATVPPVVPSQLTEKEVRMNKKAPPSPEGSSPKKIFVPDTSAIIHDPSCPFMFDEHDVYIPMIVLEELDRKKSGNSETARNARQAVRNISSVVKENTYPPKEGMPLKTPERPGSTGKLFLFTEPVRKFVPPSLSSDVPDNQIIGAAFCIQKKHPTSTVIVVSNDIALRTKAIACGMRAEEYSHDRVIEDISFLPSGVRELPENFWETHADGMESWRERGRPETFYRIRGPLASLLKLNEFVYFEKEESALFYARVTDLSENVAILATIKDFSQCETWGIRARNREQLFALNALLDPEIDLVSLLGQAGSGKTLLALAVGLHLTFEKKRYQKIIMTRLTVPIGEDIGFLPGNEEEKMTPWMGALMDNMEVLCSSPISKEGNSGGNGEGRILADEFLRRRIEIKSINFMRGRTLNQRYLIVDEAQNLTPKQAKTIVTRAGPGTKVVLLGNNAQIDTPYLTETNSGITYAVQQFHGWKHAAHIVLARCERSRLADHAEEVL